MDKISYIVTQEVVVPEHIVKRIIRHTDRAVHRLHQNPENVIHVITAVLLDGRPTTDQVLEVAKRILEERMQV